MVGSLLILKMMYYKKKKQLLQSKINVTSNDINETETRTSANNKVVLKTESMRTDPEKICRVCLKEGKLPIFGNNNTQLCEYLNTMADIQVRADDPFPKYLCQACHALLQSAIIFRKTAHKSNELLLRQKTYETSNQELVSDTDKPSQTLNNIMQEICIKIEPEFNSDNDEPSEAPSNDKIESSSSTYEERFINSPKHMTCKTCNKQFASFQEYCKHRLSSQHDDTRIACKICNNTYAQQYIKMHMALHKNETSHMCDICGKKFTVQATLKKHRLTHFYDLPYQCQLCPYKGRFPESLKMHMRSHTGEKPYHCAQCPARFISKSNLNKHILTHKVERDFPCELCNRGFDTKKGLDLHNKVNHLGVKEHVCITCGKAFGYRKQMMKHELKVHHRKKLKSGKPPIWSLVESMKEKGEENEEATNAKES